MIALFRYQSKYGIKRIHNYACVYATIVVFLATRPGVSAILTLLSLTIHIVMK